MTDEAPQKEWDINKAFESIEKFKAEHEMDEDEVLGMLLNSHAKQENAIQVSIAGLSFKVFKTIPRHVEEKIHEYRKERADYGPEYVSDTLDEDKAPLFAIIAGLCAESPYNKPSLWEKYDRQSDGKASVFFEDLMEAIQKNKEKVRRFRKNR